MQPVICLMGPTASGKTALAMSLINALPLEIVSVDSAMIYRGMNIGTAKPTPTELAQAPHRLIDICDPAESYSVAQFVDDVKGQIAEVHAAGRIPLLVGGTMMYFNALRVGLAPLPSADVGVRGQLSKEAEHIGWPAMHAKLVEIDPGSFQRIKPNDKQRIQRALEVYQLTGKPISDHWDDAQDALENPMICLAVCPESRQLLHQRIEQRWHQLIEAGFISEVAQLKACGDLNLLMPSMRCVGYRQAWEYLDGQYDMDQLHHHGIVATRRLAKRQITWLRSWPDLKWFDSMARDLEEQVCSWLQQQLERSDKTQIRTN